jgi:predicted membrane channel-forming protein YqfA (hemolysin III family)
MKAFYWFAIFLVLGIWLVVSPYALNFAANLEAFWNALTVGVVLIVLSGVAMYSEREEAASEHLKHSSQTKTA